MLTMAMTLLIVIVIARVVVVVVVIQIGFGNELYGRRYIGLMAVVHFFVF
jgi:hypothetical protein